MTRPSIAVLISAGGTSSRFGTDKLRAVLAGERVIDRTLAAIARCEVASIVIATTQSDLVGESSLTRRVDGGATRARSVANALSAVDESIEWVAVHDAARPLLSRELFERVFAAAIAHGAAAPAMAVNLTIKRASGLPGIVGATVPRKDLFAMQTPQIVRRADLARAIARAGDRLDQATDDLELLEWAGISAMLVPGEERNLKITTPMDLAIAEWVLRSEVSQPPGRAGA